MRTKAILILTFGVMRAVGGLLRALVSGVEALMILKGKQAQSRVRNHKGAWLWSKWRTTLLFPWCGFLIT